MIPSYGHANRRLSVNFIIRWIVTAIAAGAAVWLVPGISAAGPDSTLAIILFALVLSLVNVSIKPIAQIAGAPISVLTLGIFYLVVNALLLELASWVSSGLFGNGIIITSFGAAFAGSIVISIVSALVNGIIGDKG